MKNKNLIPEKTKVFNSSWLMILGNNTILETASISVARKLDNTAVIMAWQVRFGE